MHMAESFVGGSQVTPALWVVGMEFALVLSPAPGILGEERCIQGSGGEIGGKESTWETQA
jgi:hypothetical protein